MRRLLIVSALAASAAVVGACGNDPAPNKPVATPSPIGVASPLTSPTVPVTVSPATPMSGSPAKPGSTPQGKKDEKIEKVGPPKPAETPKAK